MLELTIKTYPGGEVSSRFATLREAGHGGGGDGDGGGSGDGDGDGNGDGDGASAVLVSAPRATLYLPGLTEEPPPAGGGRGEEGGGRGVTVTPAIQRLGLVVGGTGVAPALQLLREIADPNGSFGPGVAAVLLYSRCLTTAVGERAPSREGRSLARPLARKPRLRGFVTLRTFMPKPITWRAGSVLSWHVERGLSS